MMLLLGHNIREIRRECGKYIRGEIKGRWQLTIRKDKFSLLSGSFLWRRKTCFLGCFQIQCTFLIIQRSFSNSICVFVVSLCEF